MSSPGVVVSGMKPGSISRLREDGESSGGLMEAEGRVAEWDRARLCDGAMKISSFSPS